MTRRAHPRNEVVLQLLPADPRDFFLLRENLGDGLMHPAR